MLVNAPPRGLNHLLNDLKSTKFDASSELNNSLGLLCWFADFLSRKDIYYFIMFSFGVTFSIYIGMAFVPIETVSPILSFECFEN